MGRVQGAARQAAQTAPASGQNARTMRERGRQATHAALRPQNAFERVLGAFSRPKEGSAKGWPQLDRFTAHVRQWHEERRHAAEVRWLLAQHRIYGRRFVQEFLNSRPVARRRARLVRDLNAAMAVQRKVRKV